MALPEEDQPERGRLIKEAVGELKAILYEMFNLIGAAPSVDLRKQLIMAGIYRIEQTRRVILMVEPSQCPEDIWLLARPTLEVVINCSYLQFADEDEVQSYVRADEVSWLHQLGRFERVTGVELSTVNEQRRSDGIRLATEAVLGAGRPISHSAWSRFNLVERAEKIDASIKSKLFVSLYRDTYTTGNRYTHGNYSALKYFHALVRQIPQDPLSGLRDTNLALSQICKVFFAFCVFLETTCPMGFVERIRVANEKMNAAVRASGEPLGNSTM